MPIQAATEFQPTHIVLPQSCTGPKSVVLSKVGLLRNHINLRLEASSDALQTVLAKKDFIEIGYLHHYKLYNNRPAISPGGCLRLEHRILASKLEAAEFKSSEWRERGNHLV